jgi:hypothetical protein
MKKADNRSGAKEVRRSRGEEVRRSGRREAAVVMATEAIRMVRVKGYRWDFGMAKIPKLRTIRLINRIGIMESYLGRIYKNPPVAF